MRSLLGFAGVAAFAAVAAAHDWNGLAIDPAGRVYAVDAEDGQVWRVAPDGKVAVYVPGAALDEDCYHFHHLALDGEGVLWLPSG